MPLEYVEFPWFAHRKVLSLQNRGMKSCGVMYFDETGKRSTVDKLGRVQWWTVNSSGVMVPME
jgi:hypothetical protein